MKQLYPLFILVFSFVVIMSCNKETANPDSTTDPSLSEEQLEAVPEWASEVIWYQIFVERFRNGDPANDPRPKDMEGTYPGFIPEAWAITPWTQDWYQPDPYFRALDGKLARGEHPINKFEQKVQLRRYGGDLQGVLDKIDYLEELGITAVYFNPLNDAPSLHKYDARNWRHIDRNFGPDPDGDAQIMAEETPDDPATWKMTAADSMFLQVIEELHNRGIKVILDYSWNHTGNQFWAFKDLLEKGQASAYADWYFIEKFDDPTTAENELAYKGWANISSLPEIQETVVHEGKIAAYEGNLSSQNARQHIFEVSKRWLDPNDDGNPSDGVDGYRLDVAGEIGLGFWRDYRQFVRKINPQAYLLGEIWWEEWPDKLLDPKPFLEGDVFDAVMNYRWYQAARRFFAQAPEKIPVSEFVDSLKAHEANLRPQSNYTMMNLVSSHDAPRVATSLFNNDNKYKYQVKPTEDSNYKISKPDNQTYETLALLLVQQFTYIGAPHIWNGDEMGMWGADDPDCRKPLIWPDYDFDSERYHPLGKDRPIDEVQFDSSMFQFMQRLIQIRKSNAVLANGELEYLIVDDANEILAYSRFNDGKEVIAVFNTSKREQSLEIPVKTASTYRDLLSEFEVDNLENKKIQVTIPARKAGIISF